jgi:hypothetical protein
VLDKQLVVNEDGSLELDAELSGKLDTAIKSFRTGLHRAAHEVHHS